MKAYELSSLISANIDEIERDTIIENISKIINEKGGEITETSPGSEILLGYPIKDQEKARLVVFNFKYENRDLVDIKKEIEIDQKVIRCFLREAPAKKTIPLPKRKRAKREEKVELEDIDKKIEEIFNPAKDTVKEIFGKVDVEKDEFK